MFTSLFSDRGRLDAIRAILRHVGGLLDSRISAKLWDGSVVPLGPDARPNLRLAIRSPGVISSLLRRPTLDNLLRHYAAGRLDTEGADLYTFVDRARVRHSRGRLRHLRKTWIAWKLLPFVFHRADHSTVHHRFADEAGLGQTLRPNQDFIQFHYDVGNEFYQLFLGEHMQYTCNYFTDWAHSLDQSQTDKMEMICRKLRLEPGESMLDLGCGWGGLACYAAKHYGVKVHAMTLSAKQVEFARERVKRLGLEGRVTVELRDAYEMNGTYDKIASIGMFEHIGIDNYERYLNKMNSVLRDRGLALVHMITRGAKPTGKSFRKSRAEHRLIRKYIFPGSEVGNVGHLVQSMEGCRFEVHDVEGWRDHYALTLKQWSQHLAAHEQEAIRLVGVERYRTWMAYLVGCSFAFADGTLRLFQVLASKHEAKGHSRMPCTRADLYDRPMPSASMREAA